MALCARRARASGNSSPSDESQIVHMHRRLFERTARPAVQFRLIVASVPNRPVSVRDAAPSRKFVAILQSQHRIIGPAKLAGAFDDGRRAPA